MSLFGDNKAAKTKIDKSTEQVLELEAQKKRLEMERDQISIELDNQKRKFQMSLEEERHKQRLAIESEKAVFAREKEIWKAEKEEIVARAARDKKEFEETLKRQHEITLQEAVTLAKLDSQQKVKQAELDRDRQTTELRTVHAEEISKLRSESAENHYNKLTEAFQEIQLNGDKTSKFVQELALKMVDGFPKGTRTDIGVNVNQPQLEAQKVVA